MQTATQPTTNVQTVINSSQLTWSRDAWALVGYASDFPTSFRSGAWPKYITVTSRRSGAQRVFRYQRGIIEAKQLLWVDYHCKQESVILRMINA